MENSHSHSSAIFIDHAQVSASDKNWAVLLHLSLYSFCFLSFFGLGLSFVLWMMRKDESAFVDQHGKAVLNFGITITLVMAIAVVTAVFFALAGIIAVPALMDMNISDALGIGALPYVFILPAILIILGLILLVLPLLGVRSAAEGRSFKYPLAFPFFR